MGALLGLAGDVAAIDPLLWAWFPGGLVVLWLLERIEMRR